jgi:glutamate dehydrogenase/leucine dehydrogenase
VAVVGAAADVVVVVAEARMINEVPPIAWEQHIILCGLGHVGERVYALLAALGERVVVINDVAPLFWQELEGGPNSQLILGDARNDRILRQAGIATARAILIVTGNDMTNVAIAVDARKRVHLDTVIKAGQAGRLPYISGRLRRQGRTVRLACPGEGAG